MKSRFLLILASAAAVGCTAAVAVPEPYGAVPSEAQIQWQKMETNMFCHFGPNTFTSLEWGNGDESEDVFNPTDLDCAQWARTAKAAGFGGIIITAKHHDGFCLWPSPVSTHTVAQSTWRDGQGDVLKELSAACAQEGVKFGVYISPWDRNDAHYGTPEYNDVFVKALQSVHDGTYGDIFEQWFDGANGEGPNGKRQVYDWPLFNGTVLGYHPDAVIFSDCGPGCRWVGNERGQAGRTSWSTTNVEGFEPGSPIPYETLNEGIPGASTWIPSETDVSIRPGWFWKESENSEVKSLNALLKIWYESVGRNSLLLLNVPPDTRGHIHEVDSVRLMEFRSALNTIQGTNLADGAHVTASEVRGNSRKDKAYFSADNLLDNDYDTYWAVNDSTKSCSFELEFPEPRTFNRVMLQEYIPLGQRVSAFAVDVMSEGDWKTVAEETTIGYKRIVLIPETTTDKMRVRILSSLACPVLNNVELYQDNIYRPEE